jgi:tetratricopeptide (TPR) repeat protein
MIQPLKTPGNTWFLHWVDLEEPLPSPIGWFLPTIVAIVDAAGVPVAPPEVMDEPDQVRIENFLYRLFEERGAPNQLVIPANPEWDDEAWTAFSADARVPLRFRRGAPPAPNDLAPLSKMLADAPGPPAGSDGVDMVASLLEGTRRLRSTLKREKVLKAVLKRDPSCSEARVGLGDIEFQRGNWKRCTDEYRMVVEQDLKRLPVPGTVWWSDHATRPCLRALHGLGMTEWHLGNHQAAADHFTQLLALNPADNQGVRFLIPLLHLLADSPERAAAFFQQYAEDYPNDFKEPSFLFAWGFTHAVADEEAEARERYTEGILRNIYIAPLLLEAAEPPRDIWLPGDRAEPTYAAEFVQSYAVVWDREPGPLRILREVWNGLQPRIERLVALRERMMDFQDQHYEPDFKRLWQELLDEEERLCSP